MEVIFYPQFVRLSAGLITFLWIDFSKIGMGRWGGWRWCSFGGETESALLVIFIAEYDKW